MAKVARLVLVVLCCLAVPAEAQSQRDRSIALGDTAMAAERFTDAVTAYSAALAEDPRDALALQRRGRAYRELGRLAEALQDYDSAIEADSSYAPAYGGRAYTSYLLVRLPEALADVARARALGLNVPDLALIAGMAQGRAGNYAESITELERFIADQPGRWEGWYFRGLAYARTGEAQRALADFDQAITQGVPHPEVYLERSAVRGRLGDTAGGCTDLRKALAGGVERARDPLERLCK